MERDGQAVSRHHGTDDRHLLHLATGGPPPGEHGRWRRHRHRAKLAVQRSLEQDAAHRAVQWLGDVHDTGEELRQPLQIQHPEVPVRLKLVQAAVQVH